MPYPNDHACRLREPGEFEPDSFRRMKRKHKGKEYSVIIGRLKGEDTMTEQAYRYGKDTWDVDEARAHCHSHDGRFEAAQKLSASFYTFSAGSYSLRYEMFNGARHIVVPVVMLVEGVHAGSHGPTLHLAEEFGRVPETWNDIPVYIGHPQEGDAYVSGGDPKLIDTEAVGRVYGARIDEKKLKAEVWLNEAKLKKVSPLAAQYIAQGLPLEVSIGVFTDNGGEPGKWEGEAYITTARNYKPDHLALLPGGKGACSWADGCGIRANESGKNNNQNGGTKMKKEVQELLRIGSAVYTEADKTWLEALNDAQLGRLLACANNAAKAMDDAKKVMAELEAAKKTIAKLEGEKGDTDKTLTAMTSKLSDPEKFIELLSPELRDQLKHGQRLYQERREKLTKAILTNQATKVWTEEDLKGRGVDELEKLAASIKPVIDYTPTGGLTANASNVDILLPAWVETEKGGKKNG